MKIRASVSAGFSGRAEQYEIDTAASPAGKALEAALAASGFFTRPGTAATAQVGADLRRWRISATDGDDSHSVSFVEDGGAEAARWSALLAQIKAAA